MAKQNQPVWYFIDFENTNSLGIDTPKPNDKVLVFLGNQQKQLHINLVQQLIDFSCDKELIPVSGQSANNLDFHLSYYLGLYNTTAPKTAKFVVVSKDKGFDNLIQKINGEVRSCVKQLPIAI
jgi:PIN domain